MDYTLNRHETIIRRSGYNQCKKKLGTFDWLSDLPESMQDTDLVEVQFKNTRKGYFRNTNQLDIQKGDIVAVESTPGHDIGEVTLMGKLVLLQMKKNHIKVPMAEIKRIYRKAKPTDLEKWEEAKTLEHATMLKARTIAEDLRLNMKIGDVEYQGDGNKAIFYYIADERVDFRELIKIFADRFRVKIEMKQIGARQEAGRIGGIGPCGRELCCSSWMSNFNSVSTSAARYQDISLNPQKLAGQCAKLKCCINFETEAYIEASKKMPNREVILETFDANYYLFKSDIMGGLLSYSTARGIPSNLITITAARAQEIVALNRKGLKVESLSEIVEPKAIPEFKDAVGEESLTRFDKQKKGGNPSKRRDNKDNRERKAQPPIKKEGNAEAVEHPRIQKVKHAAAPNGGNAATDQALDNGELKGKPIKKIVLPMRNNGNKEIQ